MARDAAGGVPFDRVARISALADQLGRKFSAVRLRLQNIAWIAVENGWPAVPGIQRLSGMGRKVVVAVLGIYAELEAEERGGAPASWTEPQLRTALEAYREAVSIDPARAPVDLPDLVCELAQTAGRRFADSRHCLGWIASLVHGRGGRPPACLELAEDMPAETRATLERLLDAGWGG